MNTVVNIYIMNPRVRFMRTESGLTFLEKTDSQDDLQRLLLERNKQWTKNGFVTTKTNGSLKTVVLSCVDSRVQVENIFQAKPGELLVLKNAGNFTKFVIRSLLVAVFELGVKHVIILGHEYCGMAIKDNEEKMKHLIEEIGDAQLTEIEKDFQTKPIDWFGFFNYGEWDKNAREQVRVLHDFFEEYVPKEKRPIITAAVYDLDTGEVEFLK
jgi:carbonic anhydrase